MIRFRNRFSNVNRIILYLTTSDIFTWALLTIVSAFAGLYLATKFDDEAIRIVGIGVGIFSLARGLCQLPFGIYTDKIQSDKDDILVLFLGNVLMGTPLLFYPAIETPYFYYLLQAILGLGAAMNLVTWRKMFAKNLDSGREGVQYATYDTIMSFSIAIFSTLAGVIATINQSYFDAVIFTLGLIIVSSGIWPLLMFGVKNRKSSF